MNLKMSAKWEPFCLVLNVFNHEWIRNIYILIPQVHLYTVTEIYHSELNIHVHTDGLVQDSVSNRDTDILH